MRGQAALWLLIGTVAMPLAAEDSPPTRQQATEQFLGANRAYEAGDYPQAIAGYEALLTKGAGGASVHYNLGNAYLRNGELGKAIASFRRSRNLAPRDGDVRANLEFARQTTRDALAPPEPSPVLSNLLFWHYGLSRSELATVLIFVNLLFWIVAALRLYHQRSETLRWVSIGSLLLLLAFGTSVFGRQVLSSPVAVVVPQEIEALTAPDTEAVVRFKLHAGTEVLVAEQRQGWVRITLPDGQQAWIEAAWAEIVAE